MNLKQAPSDSYVTRLGKKTYKEISSNRHLFRTYLFVRLRQIVCQARCISSSFLMTAHLSGTSHTVLFNSTLWKPDFMVVLVDLGPRWLPPPLLLPPPVPLNTTGPTTQLTSNGTHHTPRLGRAPGRKNRLQAVLVGTQQKPQIKQYNCNASQLHVFQFIKSVDR